ncbi:CRISPR system precrRNA processing endoribonuclease RAMP protein Cas6 [Halodesulfurarchaeum sp. HSR-GB]|uniref:CRISPR system precrRNA processing endoribonuclease RAMP protein Cas6 n=1 Tax=Halodesulfurarchaeum sp. HSR-GB TaxID=3074077 RepID=UPI002862D583|nr:CRISPR system precrRNA processing endoribonuclease RAMP protein Cas6 [Halodesulfurarchaeum sp. HSR-GB]MDR5655889.1 CRISPR system precrRNA processing endoribonuclease RAMP protein Cas6 [Halodesulfurarchaeum sp. HSR-GB]
MTSQSGGTSVCRIDVELRPTERVLLTDIIGHPVYDTLRGLLETAGVDQDAITPRIPGVHVGGFWGRYGEGGRPQERALSPKETYRFQLGVIDPEMIPVFREVFDQVVPEGAQLPYSGGTLEVVSATQEYTDRQALLERAAAVDTQAMNVWFRTPTCLEETETRTMCPSRGPVFSSLLESWNRWAPDELVFDIDRDRIEEGVRGRPHFRTFESHSVAVAREGATGAVQTRDGFSGGVTYEFSEANGALQNALVAAALLGEIAGVGYYSDRGCGDFSVRVAGDDTTGPSPIPWLGPSPLSIRPSPFRDQESH